MINKKYSLFIGRWSPFHLGHDHIIRKELNKGNSVLIAIMDTDMSDKNPYSINERFEMISEHYKKDDVRIIVIPPINSINVGRDVGYNINKHSVVENIKSISATKIRKMIDNKDHKWKEYVPKSVSNFLTNKNTNCFFCKKGIVIWFTGLSGSGKSSLANALKLYLEKKNKKVVVLDGDEIRKNISLDLGFNKRDIEENNKRIGIIAKNIADYGSIVICSVISPYLKDRNRVKYLIGEDRFFEIYVHCDIEILKKRDTKGLYKKFLNGEIKNMVGISHPYESSVSTNLVIDTGKLNIENSIKKIINELKMNKDIFK
jgi:adenylylsulfate kinase